MFQRIYIEITNICNLTCAFCTKNSRALKQMNRDEFNHILDQIIGYTKHVYLHVQGEPFTHPDLTLFLDDCFRKGFKVHLVTNGTLLNSVDVDVFKHPALVQLSISLHANQIKLLDQNFNVLKHLIDSLEHLKISLFLRLWTNSDTNLNNLVNLLIEPNQIELIGKRIKVRKNLFIDLDDEFEWPSLLLPFQSKIGTCHAGTKMMAILSNGEITPCCLDANGLLSVGNIFTDSFKNSLENERFNNLVNGFKKRQCVETLCQKCTYRLRFNKKG